MNDTNLQKALKDFGNRVNAKAKKNVLKHSDTKALAKSLDLQVKVNPNSFELDMLWLDYGKYIDEGVRGAGGVRKTTSKYKTTNNKGKLWKIKAKGSRFKYGKSGGISAKHFKGWASRKGISPYAVAKAVYHQGIETTNFFTDPFNQEFAKLPDELVEAYALDVEDLLEFALK